MNIKEFLEIPANRLKVYNLMLEYMNTAQSCLWLCAAAKVSLKKLGYSSVDFICIFWRGEEGPSKTLQLFLIELERPEDAGIVWYFGPDGFERRIENLTNAINKVKLLIK